MMPKPGCDAHYGLQCPYQDPCDGMSMPVMGQNAHDGMWFLCQGAKPTMGCDACNAHVRV